MLVRRILHPQKEAKKSPDKTSQLANQQFVTGLTIRAILAMRKGR